MTSFVERGGWWVVGQAMLVAAVLVGSAMPSPWPWPLVVVGAAVLACGLGLGVVAIAHLGTSLTPYPAPHHDARLVEHGVYRKVRHPIYGAMMLGTTGVALLVRSPWSLLAALALGWFLATKAAAEERHLVNRYPGYLRYRTQVRRRFIPWVW